MTPELELELGGRPELLLVKVELGRLELLEGLPLELERAPPTVLLERGREELLIPLELLDPKLELGSGGVLVDELLELRFVALLMPGDCVYLPEGVAMNRPRSSAARARANTHAPRDALPKRRAGGEFEFIRTARLVKVVDPS